jgi:hypothetical protein
MATRTGSQAGNGERPVVLRRGLLLTMDDGHRVLRDAHVLCIGEQVAGIGHNLDVPDDALEIDAAGGTKYSVHVYVYREGIENMTGGTSG